MNYSALAPIYDRLMAHVGYHRWLFLIDHICQTYCTAKKNPTLFEIGGGTGVLGKECSDAGYSYRGSDLSFSMCKEAIKKGNPFFCTDARHLALKPGVRFDILLFLYDGINYLKSIREYEDLFQEIYPHIESNGFFLFDVTTQHNSLTNFNEYVDADDLGDAFYFRHSYYNQASHIQHNDFTIFSMVNKEDQAFKKYNEFHQQKVFSVNEIAESIPKDLFDVYGIWDNYSQKKYTSRSERIHFLLRKKG